MKKLLLMFLVTLAPLFAQVKENLDVPYITYEIKMGKGFDEVNSNCLMCHSFGYILNQGPQSRMFWKEKVEKMRHSFKAPISDKDTETITNYLATYYGNGK
jgi:hypothetical protein